MLKSKKNLWRIVIATLFVAAIAFAYMQGREDVWKLEFKECSANLLEVTSWETNQPEELKDYIKARYYYLANKLPEKYVWPHKDYGPITTNLKHVAIFKGPSNGDWEYQQFRKRFGTAKPPE